MSRRRKLVLATHNTHKEQEMRFLFHHVGIEIEGLGHYPEIGDIEESGTTLRENALIKARTVHKITGNPSLADDTGLEVNALSGAPGVYSARYAGENPSYEDNINKLLNDLNNIPEDNRRAQFRTVMAFVDDDIELFSEGAIKGEITLVARGDSGFGYDPIFQPDSTVKTFAEFTEEEKNRVSHRAMAAEKMKKILESYFEKENI